MQNGEMDGESKWKEIRLPGRCGNHTKALETISNLYSFTPGLYPWIGILKRFEFDEMEIGDVLVKGGGSPGHAVIVVDMAESLETGEKLFMLAQSYMPAQDIHVLSNPRSDDLSPWYSMDFEGELKTPEWTFARDNLKRFN